MTSALQWIETGTGKSDALEALLWRAGEQAVAVMSRRVEVYDSDGKSIILKGNGASGIAALTVGLATAHKVMFGSPGRNRLDGTTIDRLAGDDLAYTAHKLDGGGITFTFMGILFRRADISRLWGLLEEQIPPSRPRMTEGELEAWIAACGIENIKLAWTALRAEYGLAAPKKTEVFEPAWRLAHQGRGRGRPKKAGRINP